MIQKTALKHLVSIQSGYSPSTFELSSKGQFPYVKVEDMNNCQKYQCKSREYTNDPSHIVPKGAVIFPKRGAAIMNNKVRIAGTDLCMDTNMMAVVSNTKIVGEFLYYAITQIQLFQIADTSTIPQINNKHINPLKIPLPQLPEQEAIAEVLECWDKGIRTLEKKISKKRLIKKGLMQKLLSGQTRLPGFSKAWKNVKLEDVATMSSGGTPDSTIPEFYEGGILWASISDMTSCDMFIERTERTLTKLGIQNSAAKIFPEGTVLFAMYASIGEACIAKVPISTSQAILGITPGQNLSNKFLYHYLCMIKERLKLQGQSGTQSNLNARIVKSLAIPLPSIDEQQAIAEMLAAADGEIEVLERKLALWKDQKKFLLNNLVTGTIRLPEFRKDF